MIWGYPYFKKPPYRIKAMGPKSTPALLVNVQQKVINQEQEKQKEAQKNKSRHIRPSVRTLVGGFNPSEKYESQLG